MIRVLVTEIMLLNNLCQTCGCFTQRNQHQHTNFDCCLPCILGDRLQLPAEWMARLLQPWRQPLDSQSGRSCGSACGVHTHKRKAGTGHTSGIIEYFLVSKPICPLVQECDVLRTVRRSPHFGFCITLNIDYTAQGETPQHWVRHTGQGFEQPEGANSASCEEALRRCVFDGNKPRCHSGLEDASSSCTQ